MRVAADVDVGVFPGHRDHLVVPGYADVDADQLQFGEIAGHRIEGDRPADAAAGEVSGIDHRLADLHLDRNAEFAALGIEGIDLGVIRREFEPVRIEVRADEAEIFHRVLEFAHAFHAGVGIDAGQAVKALGILRHRTGDDLVGHVVTARQAGAPRAGGNQEGPFDVCLVELLDHLLEAHALRDHALVGIHLAGEEIRAPLGPRGECLVGPDVHDRVDGLVIMCFHAGYCRSAFRRDQRCAIGSAPQS